MDGHRHVGRGRSARLPDVRRGHMEFPSSVCVCVCVCRVRSRAGSSSGSTCAHTMPVPLLAHDRGRASAAPAVPEHRARQLRRSLPPWLVRRPHHIDTTCAVLRHYTMHTCVHVFMCACVYVSSCHSSRVFICALYACACVYVFMTRRHGPFGQQCHHCGSRCGARTLGFMAAAVEYISSSLHVHRRSDLSHSV